MPPDDPVNTEKRWTIQAVPMKDKHASIEAPWQMVRVVTPIHETQLELGESVEVIPASSVAELESVLDDVLDWMNHIEGEGRLRRTEVLERVQSALHPEPTEEEPDYPYPGTQARTEHPTEENE